MDRSAPEMLEASPGVMILMPRYKAERANGRFAVIDARKHFAAMLAMRPYGPKRSVGPYPKDARHCQIKVHRDVNAARNLAETDGSGSVWRHWLRVA